MDDFGSVENIDDGEDMRAAPDMDTVFAHLRKQDAAIDALRADVEFLVTISRNLEGFSKFCSKWGGRISRALKWLAVAGPGITLLWQWFWQPLATWWHTKTGG